MKYPKLPPDLDRRYKILPSEYFNIRNLKEAGMNIVSIADRYGVGEKTIREILCPLLRKEIYKRTRAWQKLHPRSKEQRILDARTTWEYRKEVDPRLSIYYVSKGRGRNEIIKKRLKIDKKFHKEYYLKKKNRRIKNKTL